eukprot:gene5607-6977_t
MTTIQDLPYLVLNFISLKIQNDYDRVISELLNHNTTSKQKLFYKQRIQLGSIYNKTNAIDFTSPKIPLEDIFKTNNIVQLEIDSSAISSSNNLFSAIRHISSLIDLKIIISTTTTIPHISKESIPKSVQSLSILIKGRNHIHRKNNQITSSLLNVLEIGSIPLNIKTLAIDHILFKHYPSQLIPESVVELLVDNFTLTESDSQDHALIPHYSIQKLTLRNGFLKNQLKPGCFPDGITEMNFIDVFFCGETPFSELPPLVIPESVRKLYLSDYVFELKEGVFPRNLEELIIPMYNKPIKSGIFPHGLRKLVINSFFGNHMALVESVPNLIHLRISEPLLLTLPPPLLERLESNAFSIYNTKFQLCTCLTTLELFANRISEIQIGAIPESVRTIKFISVLSIPLVEGTLPPYLENLIFENGISVSIPFPHIPNSVKKLTILGTQRTNDYIHIPSSVQHLKLKMDSQVYSFSKGILPPDLEKLKLFGYREHKYYQPYFQLIHELYNDQKTLPNSSTKQPRVSIDSLSLISFDKNDRYLYFINNTSSVEGFIQKSNLNSNLESLVKQALKK